MPPTVTPPLPDMFLVRVTVVISGTPDTYEFEEWWLTGDGTWEAKTGGRIGAADNPGYTLPASDDSEVTLAVDDFAWCRSADGAGGLYWELVAVVQSASGSSSAGWLEPCRVATTANVTGSQCEAGDTIDGVVLAVGDRLFRKDQTDASENGIFVVTAGTPNRATDADTGAKLVGAQVRVVEGTANAGTSWACVTPGPITLGTDDNDWEYQYPHPDGTDGYILSKASSVLPSKTEWVSPNATIVSGGGAVWIGPYTLSYSDFSGTAAGTGTFAIYTLPAGSVIHACMAKTTTQFSCPAGSALTMTIGVTANNSRYLAVNTLSNAPSGTNFAPASTSTAAMRATAEDFGGTTTVNAYVASGFPGFANLNTYTQGAIDICFMISTPPF